MRLVPTTLLLSTVALAGCATGPDYKPPALSGAAVGTFSQGVPGTVVAAGPVAEQWWRLYRDPVLDRLVADALVANTDVRVAIARLARARAAFREVRSTRLPTTDLGAGANYRRLPSSQTLPGLEREDWAVDAGLSVAYEVDLFGRVKRNVEAARGDAGASLADLEAVRVTVVADTTQAYVEAASAAQRLSVAKHIVELLDKSLSLTRRRSEVGLTTSLDTARIATLRDQRLADVPALEAERQSALFRLALLTGRAPSDLPQDAGARVSMPTLDAPIPVGDGAALLSRRPDIRAAEQRLAAATARIGVATSDLYPRITLGGSVGSTGLGFDDLFGAGPLRWLVGPLISWSFPNQERTRARIGQARADAQAALATFDGAVLQALNETETALSDYRRVIERRAALKSARDQAERAARILRAQQREGQVDNLALLDAERTFAETEAALAQADARIAEVQVTLFRSLGGGWSETNI